MMLDKNIKIKRIEDNIKNGKKPSYDPKKCPNISKIGRRCKGCCYNVDLLNIDFMRAKDLKKLGYDVKKEDLAKNSIFEIKTAGCMVMTDTCPNCIINVNKKCKMLGTMSIDGTHQFISELPARLFPIKDGKMFCEICGKEFKHEDVMHVVSVRIISHYRAYYENYLEEKKKEEEIETRHKNKIKKFKRTWKKILPKWFYKKALSNYEKYLIIRKKATHILSSTRSLRRKITCVILTLAILSSYAFSFMSASGQFGGIFESHPKLMLWSPLFSLPFVHYEAGLIASWITRDI